jgi:hypothetical protein
LGSTIGGLLDLVKEHVTIFFAQSFFFRFAEDIYKNLGLAIWHEISTLGKPKFVTLAEALCSLTPRALRLHRRSLL